MQTSESIVAIAPALVKAQAMIEPAPKSAENPHFGSKYTPLNGVWEAIKSALSENDLCIVQTFGAASDPLEIVTTLLHSSGEWIRGTVSLPIGPMILALCLDDLARFVRAHHLQQHSFGWRGDELLLRSLGILSARPSSTQPADGGIRVPTLFKEIEDAQ